MKDKEEIEIIIPKWKDIKGDKKALISLLDSHIEEAKMTHGNSKAPYALFKLDLRHLTKKIGITEVLFLDTIIKLQDEELYGKIEFIREQYQYAFHFSNQTNSTMMKELAENKYKLYTKGDNSDMPSIVILKPTLEDHFKITEKLMRLTKHRYDFDRQVRIIEEKSKDD